MLPSSLFDWWFAPWSYAADADLRLPLALDRFAQRDGYRVWCSQADISPDFPSHFHAAWSIAVTSSGAELLATARLFAGLMAAREHDQATLAELSFDDRKWCLSVAATQPLSRCRQVRYGNDEPIEMRGMVELARRLESGFPGLWPRLRLMLPAPIAAKVTALVAEAAVVPVDPDAALMRAQRCWRLCRTRVESMGLSAQPSATQQARAKRTQQFEQQTDAWAT